MSELERLVESDDSDLAARLVRAASRERPSGARRERALQATLGAAGLLGATTLAAGQSSATGAGIKLLALKWIGVGALVGTAMSIAAIGFVNRSAERDPPRVMQAAAPRPVIASGVTTSAPALPPAVDTTTETKTETAPKASVKPAAAGAPGGQLGEEVAALDRARGLVDRDPAAALQALDDHGGRFRRPALGPEAAVLRIEALARAGRRDEASRAAREFLARHPDGALAERVRRHAQ